MEERLSFPLQRFSKRFGDPFAAWRWIFAKEKLCTAYFVTVLVKRQLSASFRGKFPNPFNLIFWGSNLLESNLFLMLNRSNINLLFLPPLIWNALNLLHQTSSHHFWPLGNNFVSLPKEWTHIFEPYMGLRSFRKQVRSQIFSWWSQSHQHKVVNRCRAKYKILFKENKPKMYCLISNGHMP